MSTCLQCLKTAQHKNWLWSVKIWKHPCLIFHVKGEKETLWKLASTLRFRSIVFTQCSTHLFVFRREKGHYAYLCLNSHQILAWQICYSASGVSSAPVCMEIFVKRTEHWRVNSASDFLMTCLIFIFLFPLSSPTVVCITSLKFSPLLSSLIFSVLYRAVKGDHHADYVADPALD